MENRGDAMKKKIFLKTSFFLSGWVLAAAAAAASSGGVFSPLILGVSARMHGMGAAAAAVADGAGSFLDNPAALAYLEKKEITTLHATLLQETSYDALAFGSPLAPGMGAAVAAAVLSTPQLLRTENSVESLGTFSVGQNWGALGYGMQWKRFFAAGVLLQYSRQKIDDRSDSGMGLDLGFLYRPGAEERSRPFWRRFNFGLVLADLLPLEIRLGGEGDGGMLRLRPAVAYVQEGGKSRWYITAEGEWMKKQGALLRIGAEYGYKGQLFLRSGYDGLSPTFGVGFRRRSAQLDYAWLKREVGAFHRFSLSYRFGRLGDPYRARRLEIARLKAQGYESAGMWKEAREAWIEVKKQFPEEIDLEAQWRRLERLEQEARAEKEKQAQKYLNQAVQQRMQGDLAGALASLSHVLSEVPDHPGVGRELKAWEARNKLDKLYLEALEAYWKEDFEKALAILDRITAENPAYRASKLLSAQIRSQMLPLEALPPEALRLYQEGVESYLNGRLQDAAEAWRKALRYAPDHPLLQRNLAEVEQKMKEKTPTP